MLGPNDESFLYSIASGLASGFFLGLGVVSLIGFTLYLFGAL